MNVNGTAVLTAEKVERTIKTVEILTGQKRKSARRDGLSANDKFDSSPNIENYNNYSRSGRTVYSTDAQPTAQAEQTTAPVPATVNNVKIGTSPDITCRNEYVCPMTKEIDDIFNKVFGQRAAESKRMSSPTNYAWQRYFDPKARHYVGSDMTDYEKRTAYDLESQMMRTGCISGAWDNPILFGRGLGPSDPPVQRNYPINGQLSFAWERLYNRNMVTSQLNDLFNRNGVVIPDNLRLSFVIDSQHRLFVTGTDDESLTKQIEDILNSNGNSKELYRHIVNSTVTRDGEQITDQIQKDSYQMYTMDNIIRTYTDYRRQDLDIIDGKFLTKDGVDIMEYISAAVIEEFGSIPESMYMIGAMRRGLDWLIETGPENIQEMILTIDYENGSLYDVGQPYGYGPGQTGWIDAYVDNGDSAIQLQQLMLEKGKASMEETIQNILEKFGEYTLANFIEIMLENMKEFDPVAPWLQNKSLDRRDSYATMKVNFSEHTQEAEKLLQMSTSDRKLLEDILRRLYEQEHSDVLNQIANHET